MEGHLPLSTLLSQALVAFTIEFDNEAEHRVPHRTTDHGATTGSLHAPWLVSMVMWTRFMQFVPEEGISVRELQRLARMSDKSMSMWLARLGKWWGYLVVESDAAACGSKRIDTNAVVRPTSGGRKAQEIWRPLFGVIESRWRQRFGTDEMEDLRESLWAVARQFDVDLPDCLPILGYGLASRDSDTGERAPAGRRDSAGASRLPLPALLSRVLLAFAIEFERESELSLAIGANLLRVLDGKGVQVRDLPRLTGVSKESLSMAMGILRKKRFAVIEADESGSRTKVARLTAKGKEVQDAYHKLLAAIEKRWETRFGEKTVVALRESLERLEGEPGARTPPLFRGLEPYPDGWRAAKPKAETLPHFPMVLHRGGFPDGS
jgi:DNA-binding MarR family transcriptional regulator